MRIMHPSKLFAATAALLLPTATALVNADSGNTNADDDCHGTNCKKLAIIVGSIGLTFGVGCMAMACYGEKIKSFFCCKSSEAENASSQHADTASNAASIATTEELNQPLTSNSSPV